MEESLVCKGRRDASGLQEQSDLFDGLVSPGPLVHDGDAAQEALVIAGTRHKEAGDLV